MNTLDIAEIDLFYLFCIYIKHNFAIENNKIIQYEEWLVLFLMLVTFVPCNATSIDIRTEGNVQHGGMRMPSIMRISADYENGLINVGISRYSGSVQVYIYDVNGLVVGYTAATISEEGSVKINVGDLSQGNYSLRIVLDNATYSGDLSI